MLSISKTLIAGCLVLLVGVAAQAESTTQDAVKNIKGTVAFIIDGDRLILNSKNGMNIVRLKWIDAPNHGQNLMFESRSYLEKLALGRSVTVVGIESNGCLFGELFVDQSNYNLEMVRSGMAHTTNNAPIEYQQSSIVAQKNKNGVWSDLDKVQRQSGWIPSGSLSSMCEKNIPETNYLNDSYLESGRENYRYFTVPLIITISLIIGYFLYQFIDRFDDPRISKNAARKKRNKKEAKDHE